MRKFPSLLFFACLSYGCDSDHSKSISATEAAVKSILNDPDSARFKELIIHNYRDKDGITIKAACGKVSAKNSFGGYQSPTRFVFIFADGDEYSALSGAFVHLEDTNSNTISVPGAGLDRPDIFNYSYWGPVCERNEPPPKI